MITLQEGMARFERWQKTKASERWSEQCQGMLKDLLDNLDRPLSAVTPVEIEEMIAVRSQKVAPATINMYITVLKTFFNRMVKWGEIERSPTANITYYKSPPGRIRYLQPDEWKKLEAECQNGGEIGDLILVALYTGMRRGELLSLAWDQVLFDIGVLSLYRTKNGRPRAIPLHPVVRGILDRKIKCCKYVFCFGKHRPIKQGKVHRVFGEFMAKVQIPEFRFHDLRHTAASYLVMNGVGLQDVKDILGHKRIETTLRYSHLSLDHLRKAINKLKPIEGENGEP